MTTLFRRHDASGITSLTGGPAALYELCYAAPPWSETPEQIAGFPRRLAEAAARPGFAAWTAHDVDDRLLGLCYGWPTPADRSGDPFYDMLTGALGADVVAGLSRDAFEVAELCVHPEARGRGVGRALLEAAVAGRPAAWLITSPEAPAARLYERLGWRPVAPLPVGPGAGPPLAVYTLTASTQPQELSSPAA
ncbi:GNAT family N-acetyltransferase [Nonomuraea roseoviolacea]|uniref:GNAT superfamily N-acetyltransferase n=1 Tax=Nonomuraea roseoviolacea subsp. carminata TaxID=160689 RepID=A0ABT1KDI9_9ACTN|nr:GNAT family N-acetyltransferase [Nonomuraea roseoviolacea]MCP2352078.1 GNAT superfamily N-acetyltransferase [Nonomuraea roseoviolacea subsp. carminata]